MGGNIAIILPYIISFAVGFSVSDETCAGLIQVLAALGALQAGCVPLQVRRDSQYVLVMDLASTSDTHGESLLLCRDHTRKSHTRNPRHTLFYLIFSIEVCNIHVSVAPSRTVSVLQCELVGFRNGQWLWRYVRDRCPAN